MAAPPTAVAMEAYDALGVLVAGIAKAGSTDKAAIISGMEHVHYDGVRGPHVFSTQKQPDWAYHQFMDRSRSPSSNIRTSNQTPDQAAIVYPKK